MFKNWMKEFKDFALKGNVLDMAVGVIIGGAFSKIVSSLVNDIIMPLFSVILGSANFADLKLLLSGTEEAGVYLMYGQFLQNIFDFVIIAVSIFFFVKLINSFKRKKEEESVKEAPKKADDILLLEEIRDLLKNK